MIQQTLHLDSTPITVLRYVGLYRVIFTEGQLPQYYEPFTEYGASTLDRSPFKDTADYGGFYSLDCEFHGTFETIEDDCWHLYLPFSSCCKAIRILNQGNLRLLSDNELALALKHLDRAKEQKVWPIFFPYRAAMIGLYEAVHSEIARRSGISIKDSIRYGYVYLISSTDGHYKIGRSTDPSRRLKELKPGTILPIDFVLEHQIETNDMSALERRLHIQYADKRHKGEWYRLTEDDVQAIKSLKIVVI